MAPMRPRRRENAAEIDEYSAFRKANALPPEELAALIKRCWPAWRADRRTRGDNSLPWGLDLVSPAVRQELLQAAP